MRVVVAGENARELQPLRSQVNGLGHECDGTDCVSFDNLRLRLSGGTAVDLVVVSVGADEVAALAAVKQGRSSGAAVLALGVDDELRDQVHNAGASAALNGRTDAAALRSAIDRLYQGGAVRSRRGRLIVVTAAQGGVGVTTVATGIAFVLAVKKPGEAALVEMGTGTPELALDLDLTVKHGLEGLLRNHERSDPHMVRQVMVTHEVGKLNVLAYSPLCLDPVGLTEAAAQRMTVLLREMFSAVVVDLGHGATPATLEAMRLADAVVVVSRADVPGVRVSRGFLSKLRDSGLPVDKVKVAMNRSGYGGHLSAAAAKDVLGVAPDEWIPDDPGTLSKALELGRPLIDYYPRARVSRAMEKLAKAAAPASF